MKCDAAAAVPVVRCWETPSSSTLSFLEGIRTGRTNERWWRRLWWCMEAGKVGKMKWRAHGKVVPLAVRLVCLGPVQHLAVLNPATIDFWWMIGTVPKSTGSYEDPTQRRTMTAAMIISACLMFEQEFDSTCRSLSRVCRLCMVDGKDGTRSSYACGSIKSINTTSTPEMPSALNAPNAHRRPLVYVRSWSSSLTSAVRHTEYSLFPRRYLLGWWCFQYMHGWMIRLVPFQELLYHS